MEGDILIPIWTNDSVDWMIYADSLEDHGLDAAFPRKVALGLEMNPKLALVVGELGHRWDASIFDAHSEKLTWLGAPTKDTRSGIPHHHWLEYSIWESRAITPSREIAEKQPELALDFFKTVVILMEERDGT